MRFSSRLLPDSRVDPWRLRIRISVLWQRGEIQPVQVQTDINANSFGRCIFFDQPMHLTCVQWMTVAQQHLQSRERSRKRSGAQTQQKSIRSVSHTHWHVYKKNQSSVIIVVVFKESKDSLLLKELGPEGRGQISVVQQLLDEVRDENQSNTLQEKQAAQITFQ